MGHALMPRQVRLDVCDQPPHGPTATHRRHRRGRAAEVREAPTCIPGSSTLTRTLAAGLIDYSLDDVPITLDRQALVGTVPPGSYRLLDQQVGAKGVIVTRWVPAGRIPTGDHPHPSTSAAEVERQRRMSEGSW